VDSHENLMNTTIAESINLQVPLLVSKDTSVLEMLMIFQEKKSSLAIITDEIRKKKNSRAQASFGEEMFFSVEFLNKKPAQ
jgi:hypothetical protein